MCSSTVVCHYALFEKDSKQCSLGKATPENLSHQDDSEETKSEKILLEKVGDDERKSECKILTPVSYSAISLTLSHSDCRHQMMTN